MLDFVIVALIEDEDGAFTAEVPALPGCVSHGATRDEALVNVRDAIVMYLEELEIQHRERPAIELVQIAC